MTELVQRIEFWVAMVFAVLIKLRASPQLTRTSAVLTTVAAVMGALIFTDPVNLWLGLGEGFRYAVAALVALTCGHVARMLMALTVKDLLALWRGKP